MATMKPIKEPEGRQGEEPNPRAMAGYNSEIDAIREKEFPMLKGMLTKVQTLGSRDSRILQVQPTSTTQAQRYTPNLS